MPFFQPADNRCYTHTVMKKELLWGAAIILVIAAALFYYARMQHGTVAYQAQKEAPGLGITGIAASSTDQYDTLITFTDDGYSPAEVTITQGTRVRFLNNSTMKTWPASGVHPTHTLYPEKEPTDCLGSSFDACRDLASGEFFDFTFNYVGQWRYHDHSHAYQTGVINVTAKP